MKLSLVVLTAGKGEGKVIPITLSQFVIGRDPQCQLRPASAVVSKRHCAVLVRGNKVFLRDFDSMNGTFVNDRQIKGEVELLNGDKLKVGPLLFGVRVEATTPVNKPTPVPPSKVAVPQTEDDSIAEMLLDGSDSEPSSAIMAETRISDMEGSTVMDLPRTPTSGATAEADKPKDKAKPVPVASTASAAEAILEKYMRRPRS